MDREKFLSNDRLRYSKNKISAVMAYLAILFNAIYFAFIYKGVQADVSTYYFNITVGVSVLVNIVFMLLAFLASEGVKNYKIAHAVIMFVLAGLQVFRIFGYPINAHATTHAADASKLIMGDGLFTLCLIMLIASAVCLVYGGVITVIKAGKLKAHNALIESGETVPYEEPETQVPIVDNNNEEAVNAAPLGEEPVKQKKNENKE